MSAEIKIVNSIIDFQNSNNQKIGGNFELLLTAALYSLSNTYQNKHGKVLVV
jgi:hypothetical protein